VRKVTKTGAGAILTTGGAEQGARVVEAVANAVDVPVTVKMRRGVDNGSRDFAVAGPRFVEAGAQALTLHPRSAKQMYTGHADHALTAELVELVDVPVIASGDITSRERAHAVLETTGCAAVMIGRGAQGNPWLLASLAGDADVEPTNEEVVAELVRFGRETVRELGEQRAVHFLRKFHGWYLRRGHFPRTLRQELSTLGTTAEVEAALFAAAPGALPLVAAMEAEIAALGSGADDAELDLPISVYGGG
jgi:tRNA-dihydrouridine synthase